MVVWPGACMAYPEPGRIAQQWASQGAPLVELVEYALMATTILTAPDVLFEVLRIFALPAPSVQDREVVYTMLRQTSKSTLAYVLARGSALTAEFAGEIEDNNPGLRAHVAKPQSAYAHAFFTQYLGRVETSGRFLRMLAQGAMVLVHFEKPVVIWECLTECTQHGRHAEWVRVFLQRLYDAESAVTRQFDAYMHPLNSARARLVELEAEAKNLKNRIDAEELDPAAEEVVRNSNETADIRYILLSSQSEALRARLHYEHTRVLFAITGVLLVQFHLDAPKMTIAEAPSEESYDMFCLSLVEESVRDASVQMQMHPPPKDRTLIPREWIDEVLAYFPGPIEVYRTESRVTLALEHYRSTDEIDTIRVTPIRAATPDGAGWWLAPCVVHGLPSSIDFRAQRLQRITLKHYQETVGPFLRVAAAACFTPFEPIAPPQREGEKEYVYFCMPPMLLRNVQHVDAIPFDGAKRRAIVWLYDRILTKMDRPGVRPALPLIVQNEWQTDADGRVVAVCATNVYFSASERWYVHPPPQAVEVMEAREWGDKVLSTSMKMEFT